MFSTTSSWAGSSRGTELNLRWAENGHGQRDAFIFNGMLTFITTYDKTQSHHGHGRLVARVPAFAVSRLLILMFSVVSRAASLLATYVMDLGKANTYLTHVFVELGRPIDGDRASKALQLMTTEDLGNGYGSRDWRQILCTILINIARCDFGVPDDDDHDLKEIHRTNAHSEDIGNKRYALQVCDAVAEISHTAVASMQRVSMRWHATTGMLHPARSQKLSNIPVSFLTSLHSV